jgi:hypothetical protein
MNPVVSLVTALIVSLAVSSAILSAIVAPLRRTLAQLCPSAEATSFWVSFTAVMLYITPLMLTLIVMPTTEFALPVEVLRGALIAALFGIFGGMLVIGYQIAKVRVR